MIKLKKVVSNGLMGILLPFSELAMGMLSQNQKQYAHNPYIVLDENGKLWLIWNTDIIHYAKKIEPFCLAVMRFDEKQNITDIFPFVKHSLCSTTTYNLPFDKDDIENVSYKYLSLEANVIASGENVTGEVRIINYLDGEGICIGSKSFFIDCNNCVYHELSSDFTSYIKERTSFERRDLIDFLLFNPLEIERIYDLVQNFNPYLVFESYKIQIEYKHMYHYLVVDPYKEYDSIGRFKTYSISYFDEYLAKWFTIRENLLDKKTISDYEPFKMDDFGNRFIEEENKAKAKAYAEYNQNEHFECLMQKQYRHIYKHVSLIKKKKTVYPQYKWLPSDMNIRNVYHFIGGWCSRVNWNEYSPKRVHVPIKWVLSEAIEAYNNI